MRNFKDFLMLFTMSVMIGVAFTITQAFENKSILYFMVALIITVGMCWFMVFAYKVFEKGSQNRYSRKLRKLALDAIQGVQNKYDLSIKGLELRLNGAYIDIVDLMNNQRIVDTLSLPSFRTYMEHPEVLSLASKQDLEHTIYVIVSRYEAEGEENTTEDNNGGK